LNPTVLAEWRYTVEQHHLMLAEGRMFDILTARPFLLEVACDGLIHRYAFLLRVGIDCSPSTFQALDPVSRRVPIARIEGQMP